MIMFVYTKNEKVIAQLKADGAPLLQTLEDGTKVFVLSPTSNYSYYQNKPETTFSDRLTF